MDFEHQNDTPAARLSGPVPAAGWIKELQSRSDGIRGPVEWAERAAALIAAKEYRFLSPIILHQPDTHEIMRLKGASPVHSPNFVLIARASQDVHGGMRDWALAFCRSDETAFDTVLQKSGPTFGGLLKNHVCGMGQPPAAPATHRSDAADAICAQLGLPLDHLPNDDYAGALRIRPGMTDAAGCDPVQRRSRPVPSAG